MFFWAARRRGPALCRQAEQNDAALHWVRQLGLDIDVRQPVEQFPVAIRQLIEIAKALSQNARVIVMDEPTSALNAPEVNTLFALIQSLKARGCGIVYITHKMEEIERIADRITVLRDGQWIGTAPAAELPRGQVDPMDGRARIGRTIPAPRAASGRGTVAAGEFQRLSRRAFPPGPPSSNVSLSVRAGEVLGIGGLQGSGRQRIFSRPVRRLRPGHRRPGASGRTPNGVLLRRARPSTPASPC